MQFLNPAVLFGLTAALAPLALHLLHRGRSRPLPFSSLRFLQRLHHSRMRQVRLRQWLVLILRTLIIALLVCAFARPAYRGGQGWGGRWEAVAGVVLLDRSASTAYRLPGGTVFAQLRQQAQEVAGLFEARDRLAVIPFAEQPQAALGGAPGEHLTERLREMSPGQGGTDLQAALRAAARQLNQWPGLEPEVYLLTDLAAHDWAELKEPRAFLGKARVYVSAPLGGEPANVHVDQVHAPSWMPAVGSKLRFDVRVANTSPRPANGLDVDLFLDAERVAQQQVDLRPGEAAPTQLVATPRRAGRLAGFAQIPDDALAEDNRRYFVVGVPEQIDVWLLGPQPHGTYYAHRALAAAAQTDVALRLRAGLLPELEDAALQGTEVLVLCNLDRLTPAQTRLVQAFVAGGGGLILFPGAQADLNYLNRELLPPLLPAAVKGVVGRPGGQAGFQVLDSTRVHRPLFADLVSPLPQDQPHFAASFEVASTQQAQPLALFADGRVAMASAWREQGRTVLLAFPLDLEWSDLPLKGLFAPLLHRLVRDLSLTADRQTDYVVGQAAQRYLPGVPTSAAVRAESPSGDPQLLEAQTAGDRPVWRLPHLGEAGIWKVWWEGQEVDQFAVNLDPAESDLARISPEEVRRLLGVERTFVLPPAGELRKAVLGSRYGREVWREFLAAVVVLLVLEMWVARAPHASVSSAASEAGPHSEPASRSRRASKV
ncbi:MAG: BatA domain-containing protein [Candidatus Latescibacterota bacterium]